MGGDSSQTSVSDVLWKQYHAAHVPEDPARAAVWSVVAQHLATFVPPESHVLELGAGYCCWINSVDAQHKVAIDVWQRLPEYAGADVRAIVHDLEFGLLPVLEGQQFDVVLASNLLEHLQLDAVSCLATEVRDCLRAGGRFIVIQPNYRYAYRHYFDDYTHRTSHWCLSCGHTGLASSELSPSSCPTRSRIRGFP
jgi:SAM-dependent methyltransferase